MPLFFVTLLTFAQTEAEYEEALKAGEIARAAEIAFSFAQKAEGTEAEKYYQKAFEHSKEVDDRKTGGKALYYLGLAKSQKGQSTAALKDLIMAKNFLFQAEEHEFYVKALLKGGEIFEARGEHQKAINAFKTGFAEAMEYNYRELAFQCASQIERVYTKRGDKNSAKIYRKLAEGFSEIHEENKTLTVEKENAELKEKVAKKQRGQAIIALVGVLLIAGVLGALFVLLRKKNKVIAEEQAKSERLLLNILPQETAAELKETGHATPRSYASASVLFTDFKGFTKIAEKLSPEEIIRELDYCFAAFDEICDRHNIEKIKTIGDAYMCAAGIPAENTTHPTDMVKAGLAMQKFMAEWKAQKDAKGELCFELRLGIHTGPLVAGVVGKNKFAYDIWGDTVNLAARMESSGEVGKVNISGDTYDLVKHSFQCEHRGKIQAKNKGEVDMYFVQA